MTQPTERVVHHQGSAAFNCPVAVHARAAQAEAGIVDLKAPVKAGSGTIERIKDERAHEGSGVVARPA